MPGTERCQNKEHFGPWLLRQINSNQYEGVCWLDENRTLFRVPWKHFNMRNVDEKDYAIFKAWAIQSGRYNPNCEDLHVYKTNLRCALNSVSYRDRKMFSVHKDNSKEPQDPHKIFKFHGVHEDCSSGLLPASQSRSSVEARWRKIISGLNSLTVTFSTTSAGGLFQQHLLEVCFNSICWRFVSTASAGASAGGLFQQHLLEVCFNSICWRFVSTASAGGLFQQHLLEVCFNSICWRFVSTASAGDANLQNELEHDEDYRLRTSPDVACNNPLSKLQEEAVIAELLQHVYLGSDNGTLPFDLSQDDYPLDMPQVDQVFRQEAHGPNLALEEPSVHGHEQPLAVVPNNDEDLFYGLGTQQMVMVNEAHTPCTNHSAMAGNTTLGPSGHVSPSFNEHGSAQEVPVNPQEPIDYRTLPQTVVQIRSLLFTLFAVVGVRYAVALLIILFQKCLFEVANAVSIIDHVLFLIDRIPKLTSWEITVSYRGKEVLKQNISKRFYITQPGRIANSAAEDIVSFPSTDSLVCDKQIHYTNTILQSVGDGLLLEVSPDFKLYATRLGRARIYWSLSGNLETKENASQSKKLERDVPTGIFDFSQFWEELKDYKYHRRSSPDYTIYLSFGHYLFEPIDKTLVLVKLVPSFCTFYHQVAQQEGASSLHNEQISLQISNGSSFNSFNGSCLMDIDFSCLL
ncbi:interferon regulatory factor 7 [Gastrophryne carolinensis]